MTKRSEKLVDGFIVALVMLYLGSNLFKIVFDLCCNAVDKVKKVLGIS